MSNQPDPSFERWVQTTAAAFPYPPPQPVTAPRPQTSPGLRLRPLATAALLALLAISLWLVPPVRATLNSWWQVGSVWIGQEPAADRPTEAVIPLSELPNLPGQTTAAEATAALGLPTDFADEFGPPTAVYLYDSVGQMATFYWAERPLLLHLISQNMILTKISPASYAEPVQFEGETAYWISGERQIELYDGQMNPIEGFRRVVDGPVLIWVENDLTYRLEGAQTKEEALALASALRNDE